MGGIVSRFWTGAVAVLAIAGACLAMAGAVEARKSRVVEIDLKYPIGSIVIVNDERKLYYVLGEGRAIQYSVAVGTASELWTGRSFVADKKVDPKWIPVDGSEPVEGGLPNNPLGKRALYLDWSLLRIHGTPSRGSIGSAVSNGCVRMLNEDVIDLYDRVHIGAPVFAITSLADNGLFVADKAGTRVYTNPEARRVAKLQEEEARRWRESGGYDPRFDGRYSRWSSGPYYSAPYYTRRDPRTRAYDRRYDPRYDNRYVGRGLFGWW